MDFYNFCNITLMRTKNYWEKRQGKFEKRNINLVRNPKLKKVIDKKIYSNIKFYPTDFRKKFLTNEKLLINHLMGGGKFDKARAYLQNAYNLFFFMMLYEAPNFFKIKYKFASSLKNIIDVDSQWYNFNKLLIYFLKKTQPAFTYAIISTISKFRRVKKVLRIMPFKLILRRIPEQKRRNFSIRELSLFMKSFKRRRYPERILLGLLDLFLMGDSCILMKNKIKTYKHVMGRYAKYRTK